MTWFQFQSKFDDYTSLIKLKIFKITDLLKSYSINELVVLIVIIKYNTK